MRAWAAAIAGVLALGCGDPCASPQPGVLCALAGTGEMGFNRDGRPPRESDLYLVSAVRRGPDGRVYLMDFNNQRLRVIEDDRLETIAGNGFHAAADVTMPATESPLENPIDFDFLPDGRLVFVSYHDPRVLMLDHDGRLVVLAGTGELAQRGDEGDFEEAIFAQFIQLDGIVIDDEGAIYVSDSLAHRVRVIRDGFVFPVAGDGREAYAGDGGPATEASLHWPTALALDPDGALLVADTRNHVVRRIDAEGVITTLAGDGTAGFAGDGGPARAARFDQPYGLAVDDDGAIYVSDRGNFRVRRIAPDGVVETVAGSGTRGLDGDGGPATEAELGYVARVALDGDALLIADQSNGCARRLILR